MISATDMISQTGKAHSMELGWVSIGLDKFTGKHKQAIFFGTMDGKVVNTKDPS
jgi:hypothetical protein